MSGVRPAIRRISNLLRAERCPPRTLPRCSTPAQRKGLAFQRKVGKTLAQTCSKIGAKLEAEPWFSFLDEEGQGQAVPDFLLSFNHLVLTIEVKLTYTEVGSLTLTHLYVPIVSRVYPSHLIHPLIICRNLTPEVKLEQLIHDLRDAVHCRRLSHLIPVLHWMGVGQIRW